MKKIHETLLRLYEVAGTNKPSEVAFKLNTAPATVSNWGERGVSMRGAIKASEVYQTDVNYILYGKTTPNLINSPSYHINNQDLTFSDNASFNQNIGNPLVTEEKVTFIPTPAINTQQDISLYQLIFADRNLHNIFALRACDDYLQPIIEHNAIVIVEKIAINEPIYNGKIYVLDMQGVIICRYLEQMSGNRIKIFSEKDKQGEIIAKQDFDNEYKIMGRVVWQSSFID